MEEPREWLKDEDASAYLGFGPRYLETLRAKNAGPAFHRPPGSGAFGPVRYKVADLDAWMARGRVEPGSEPLTAEQG